MSELTGLFRYVPHLDVAEHLNQDWRWCGEAPEHHGEYSAIMWWFCVDCEDDDATFGSIIAS